MRVSEAMPEWMIRYEDGRAVEVAVGDQPQSAPYWVELANQARAARDAEWLSWIEEERARARRDMNDPWFVERACDRLRARVETKEE